MIATAVNIFLILKSLSSKKKLALDTETTGLRPYHGDKPFLIIVADETQSYVFDLSGHQIDPRFDLRVTQHAQLAEFFRTPRYWYLANAKFDMAMLAREGFELRGEVHDLQTYERILDSTLFGKVFSLGATAKRYGFAKDSAVDAYIMKHKLYTVVKVEGKKTKDKLLHFDQVPPELILPYAENDARITYDVGAVQEDLAERAVKENCPDLSRILTNERRLTRTVYEMERVGVKVDLQYCRRAIDYETQRHAAFMEEFKQLAGCAYVDSAKCFAPLFAGTPLIMTEKGNPCFDAESLPTYKHELTPIILGVRDAKAKSNYYHGFLHYADLNGVIHASFNQYQARTGRFSSSQPNLQNLSKPDDEELADEFVVRRAIVPRDGCAFFMFDYDQVEYRLMLEYAGCMALIEKVLAGLDVHQATADLAGITRRQAKTTNFLTIYGGGDDILAKRLGVSVLEARRIREAIFAAAPEIRQLIADVTYRAKERKWIYNWFGRRLYFPDSNTCYRATNHLIQGGCADVIKVAMNEVADYLRGLKTRLVLTIHDELVLEGPADEAPLLAEVQRIMQSVYPSKLLPLTAGVDHSFKSLADKLEGLPC